MSTVNNSSFNPYTVSLGFYSVKNNPNKDGFKKRFNKLNACAPIPLVGSISGVVRFSLAAYDLYKLNKLPEESNTTRDKRNVMRIVAKAQMVRGFSEIVPGVGTLLFVIDLLFTLGRYIARKLKPEQAAINPLAHKQGDPTYYRTSDA